MHFMENYVSIWFQDFPFRACMYFLFSFCVTSWFRLKKDIFSVYNVFFLLRFTLVQRTGALCTALAFTLRRRSEFLLAMADYSMKCYDIGMSRPCSLLGAHIAL